MEEHYSGDINYDLIARYLSKEAVEEEIRVLESWVKKSPENAALFAKARTIWIETEASHFEDIEVFEPNTDAAWNKISKKINQPKPKVFQLQRWMQVAAIFLLVCSVIFYFNKSNQPELVEMVGDQSTKNLALEDGSSVTLNQYSKISYPKSFNKEKREIKLEGEAFFNVKPDQSRPFIIKTNLIDVEVLGTSFNVNALSNDTVEVYVESGVVSLSNDYGDIKLNIGETGYYLSASHLFTKKSNNVVTSQFWRNKRLSFRGTTLEEVVSVLNDLYQVHIQIADQTLSDKQITVRFENQEIDVILDVIANTLALEVDNKGAGDILLKSQDE